MSMNKRAVEQYMEAFARSEGGFLNAVFCDVFEMQESKIRRLTSYLMELPD